jgi:hypothetical protein
MNGTDESKDGRDSAFESHIKSYSFNIEPVVSKVTLVNKERAKTTKIRAENNLFEFSPDLNE